MDISIAIDPWLVIVIIATFIALRVYHPITSLVKKRKKYPDRTLG
jgi:hypothetical protein